MNPEKAGAGVAWPASQELEVVREFVDRKLKESLSPQEYRLAKLKMLCLAGPFTEQFILFGLKRQGIKNE